MMYFFIALMLTVITHELGHAVAALLNNISVKVISIGLFKPYLTFKVKKIEFRISPWLIGGYTLLKGEHSLVSGGFLSTKYTTKLIIAFAGILVNLFTSVLIYLYNCQSILKGFSIDFHILKLIIFKQPLLPYITKLVIFNQIKYLNLTFVSVLLLIAVLFNLLPIPALDGAWIWEPMLLKIYKNKSPIILKKLNHLGFVFLLIIQLLIIWYLYK